MKKIFSFCMVVLVAMCGLNSCSDDCNHDFIEHDYSQELVGTWTCLQGDYAEALVIKADGSVLSTGVEDGEYWENIKGTIRTSINKMTMTFEDDDNFEGRFEMLSGKAFTIYEENGEVYTYYYCDEDLSEELKGMWVCTDGPIDMSDDMMIRTFTGEGKTTFTGLLPFGTKPEAVLNYEVDYKVVGDLVFLLLPDSRTPKYTVEQLVYFPDATELGDMMIFLRSLPTGDGMIESSASFLRIKQYLELPGQKYDYIKTYVSNVKGADKEVEFMGHTFNFAKMDGVLLDKMLKTLLFTVEFPDANTIKYSCHYNSQAEPASVEAPIVVDGNKMTIKISEVYPGFKDVDMYTFQDKDNTQMHMYMPTYSFVNFFGNMQVIMMSQLGKLDPTDAAAVKAVYDSIGAAVKSINLSLIMTKAGK